MDAETLYRLLKPHLETMEPGEKLSLSRLISARSRSSRRRKILSLSKAKEKLRLFRSQEMTRSQQEL